jgi:23S rRNA pseudouridine2605 synthase
MTQERVQKALARMGYGSRREIERLIGEEKIRINGQVAKLGDQVNEGDKINIGNRRVVISPEAGRIRVLAYNKPEGEICTQKDEKGRKTVFDSIGKLQTGRWISVGRLDINSSGLLLFTNYGELANHLMHPSSEIEREYAVRVHGPVSEELIKRLLKGVELEDGVMKFEQIVDAGGQGSNHWYHVILKEGKNREVRRLWQSQDITVSRLIRVRYANLVLPRDLKLGKKVELSLDEIKSLFAYVKLDWPEENDELAKERSDKAKSLSIKNQLYGSRSQTKSARSSQARSGQASRSTARQPAKTVQSSTVKSTTVRSKRAKANKPAKN